MSHVRASCGEPANIKQYQQAGSTTIQATEWIYMPSLGQTQSRASQRFFNSKLIVVFQNQHVVEIREKVPAYNSNFFCYRNNLINIGDDEYRVRSACGVPTYIKRTTSSI